MKKKNNNASPARYIPAIDLCLDGKNDSVYQKLGNNRIEIAELYKMPFELEESRKNQHLFFVLQFIWWARILYQVLMDHRVGKTEVNVIPVFDFHVGYSIILDCESIEKATEHISNIHTIVKEIFTDKMKSTKHFDQADLFLDLGGRD